MNTRTSHDFDVIVIGGGHAGIEAAYAAAKMGSATLLVSIDAKKIGLMPCNPAIGGIGKGHIVYEVSALGGLMPKLCTQTYLQARMLNTSKGPAVQGLRLQIDKYAYSALSQKILAETKNLTIHQGMVDEINVNPITAAVSGIRMSDGTIFTAATVILTTGTFLNGKIHIGEYNTVAGRRGEQAALGLSPFLQKIGLKLGRLKTGTPPRLLRESLDFSKMEYQEPDELNYLFEFHPHKTINSHACYITRTTAATHEIIRKNIHRSAMYNGNISGKGPRYCPSIEDKIGRFPDKDSHQIFVEPESRFCHNIYPNGISTSLPADVQEEYVRTIPGFENAVITQTGYAIEYDFVFPNQLNHTLETKVLQGLFLAGQINGTTGYEEAAGQGIIAGINAHCKAHTMQPFVLDRSESYIGILIDDLVTMGVDEPYRMFTSRAERRLLLRQDNAFLRLTDKAYKLGGLIEESLYQAVKDEEFLINSALTKLVAEKKRPELAELFTNTQSNRTKILEIIGMPLSDRALLNIQAHIQYGPYLERELKEVARREQHKTLKIPLDFVYTDLPGLSKELQQKLSRIRPATLADTALIPGMTPAAITLLIFMIKRHAGKQN